MTISPKNGYLLALVVITLFSLASYASYAMFTVYEEHQRVLTMQAGSISLTMNGKKLDQDNSITIPAGQMMVIDIDLVNNSNTSVKADINYVSTNNDIDIKYVADPGSIVPDNNGDLTLTANQSAIVTVAMYNTSGTDGTITFSKDVGLSTANLVGENTVLVSQTSNPFDKYGSTNLARSIYANNTVRKLSAPVQSGFSMYTAEANGLYKYVDSAGTIVYWFRGTSVANYINFSYGDWRILGIQNDGTVKLITEPMINHNNSTYVENTGTVGGATYTEVQYNKSYEAGNNRYGESTLDKYVRDWYNNSSLINYDNKIATNVYCSDRSYDTNSPGATSYYSSWQSVYGLYNRARIIGTDPNKVNPNPNSQSVDNYIWEYTPYMSCENGDALSRKIATITADEYVLAGGVRGYPSNYLNKGTGWK